MIVLKRDLYRKQRTKVLDHLGLVAGMCKELKIAELLNKHLPTEAPDKILSLGHAVVGLILNGLGYVNKRLYLVPRFFKNKPVSKLLGVSYLKSEHFNDDALGRALDTLYEHGVSELYALISSSVIKYLSKHYGLVIENGHVDNTNFHLHGKAKTLKLEETEEILLEVTHGYSKDYRPDLVQIGLQLINDNKSNIPLLMKVLSGNEEEGKSYGACIKEHVDQLKRDYGVQRLIIDSKLYNQSNLEILSKNPSMNWITRVPNTLAAVQDALVFGDRNEFQALPDYEAQYTYQVICSTYGGVAQRWLVLHSATKYEVEYQKLTKRLVKQDEKDKKAYKKFSKQDFETSEKALKAASLFSKKLKYNTLEDIKALPIKHYAKAGRPKKSDIPEKISYQIQAKIQPDLQARKVAQSKLGYFILATNELEEQQLKAQDILKHYKSQSCVERSFRFLKDASIVGSSLFVQKPQRIAALLMIMTLCLLVYSALEYKTRTLLKKEQLTFKNQNGQASDNPSMNWIFECFEGIHILYSEHNKPIVINLEEEHLLILNLFGKEYWKYYT